ncbi:hypothetical protein ES708_08580 [subsurface metagenome]
MTDLEKVIQYWKARLEHPPINSQDRLERITATIAYLERLNKTWKGKQPKQ